MARRDVGLLKTEGENVEDLLVRIAEKLPIELDERSDTLSKPLIIESACPGWQPKHWGPARAYPVRKPSGYQEGGIRYPAVPCSIDEQVQVTIESIKAGASLVHMHPREPNDCIAVNDPRLIAQIYDKVLAKVDAVSSQHTWERTADGEVDYTGSVGRELLKLGNGNLYCQGAVVLWPPGDAYPPNYIKSAQEGIRFMEENDIKPILKLRSPYSARQLKRVLIDTNVITKKPYVLVHDMGHPFGWPMDMEPWMPVDLIMNIVQTKQRLGEDHVIGVFSGGRNWLPITMTAILAGVDLVRVGIEDCYWMYPHKDEVIQSNMDTIRKIVDFCNLIGRPIANAAEARKILGIKVTRKS